MEGKFWLTFRSCPDGHMVHPRPRFESSVVLTHRSGKKSIVFRTERDHEILTSWFQDKLFVYTGTWWSGDDTLTREDYDLNKHLGYAVYSEGGDSWSEPTQLEGTYGHYI